MRSPSVRVWRPVSGRLHTLAGAMPLALLAACGLPTEVPKTPIIDVRWVVPSQSTRITVANFLPNGVTVLADNSGFTISVPSASVTRTLAQDCAACVAANGATVPKPAFVATATMTSPVPADISSATLTGGTLQVVVTNGYNFDPLYPNPTAGTPTGFAIITVSNGGTVIGKDSVNGATTRLPAGGSLTRSIALAGNISGSSPVTVSMSLTSPAGEPVLINTSRSISVTATPANLKVASANVIVANRQVNSASTIDLADVDSTIINHVKDGSIQLTMVNPFNVTGTLTVKLTPQGGATITKTVPLAVNTSTTIVTLQGSELRSLLGHSVTISYTGTVNAPGVVNITPTQAVVVTTRLDINLEVGG